MNKTKYLLVKGVAGLGNRLLTISAAIEYAEKTNRILVVDWSEGLYGKKGTDVFNEVFEPIRNLEYLNLPNFLKVNITQVYPNFFKNKFTLDVYDVVLPIGLNKVFRTRFGYKLGSKIFGSKVWISKETQNNRQFWKNKFVDVLPYGKNLSESLRQELVLYVDYVSDKGFQLFLKSFRIKESFITKISQNLINVECRTVGLHIRNTDLKDKRLDLNKIFVYINEMDSDVKIYLATDSGFVRQQFEMNLEGRLFPAIMKYPEDETVGLHNYFHYQSEEEAGLHLKQSTTDIINLSRCHTFFGHKGSTFSQFVIAKREAENRSDNLFWQDIVS